MLVLEARQGVRTMMISFRRGDLIIEGLRELFQREGIDAALITSGIGSLDICNLHTISHGNLPPQDRFFSLEGAIEVASLQGSVAGGEPHIHVCVDDVLNHHMYVGHLEPGSRCCYRVELGITVLEGVKTRRVTDPATGLIDIVAAED